MDPVIVDRQKIIQVRFVEIADVIANWLGLTTQLHSLNLRSLAKPECTIGVYTDVAPFKLLLGTIDVRFGPVLGKAEVTSALFRDAETAVDDWTFDVSDEPERLPNAVDAVCDPAIEANKAGVKPSKDRDRLYCPDSSCAMVWWFLSSIGAACPECGAIGASIVAQDGSFETPIPAERASIGPTMPSPHYCVLHGCSVISFNVGDSKNKACPKCDTLGELSAKPSPLKLPAARVKCVRPTCRVDIWDMGKRPHQTECPVCGAIPLPIPAVPAQGVAPITADHKPAKQKPRRLRCVADFCDAHEFNDVGGDGRCPECLNQGVKIEVADKQDATLETAAVYRLRCVNTGCREWNSEWSSDVEGGRCEACGRVAAKIKRP